MADNTDIAPPAEVTLLDRHPMRDDEGQIRQEFVDQITRAIQAADATFLRGIVAELHVMPAFSAASAHRRDLSRAAEEAIRMALVSPARAPAPGTRDDRRA